MSKIYEALQRAGKSDGLDRPLPFPRAHQPESLGIPVEVGPARFPDAMTELFGALRPLLDSKPGCILHFVGATAGEGASTVAAEFARAAATIGHRRTLLLDGDLRDPATSRNFECATERGVIDCVRHQVDPGQALRSVANSTLSVGRMAGAGAAAIDDSEAVKAVYASLRSRFDLVVMDCPPIGTGGYSDLLPEAADGIILVVQAERMRPAVVAHAKGMVLQAGGNFVGAVLNKRRNHIPGFLYRAI